MTEGSRNAVAQFRHGFAGHPGARTTSATIHEDRMAVRLTLPAQAHYPETATLQPSCKVMLQSAFWICYQPLH